MLRGTLIAQVFGLLGSIFLAKIYGEEAYGYLGFFISIVSISSIISTLQLDKCIVTSKNEKESRNWFNFLFLFTPLASILIFVFIVYPSSYFVSIKQSNTIIFLALFTSFFFTLNLVHQNFYTFKKEFSIISNSRILLTVSNFIFQFLLYYKYDLFGLIIGFLSSQFLLFLFFTFKNKNNFTKPNFSDISVGIKSNSSIVKFLLPSNTINSLANNLMPVLILAFFGAKEAGIYFFSVKILSAPLFLISSSVSQVFFQKSSELYRKNNSELLKLTKKIVKTNLLLMFLFLVIINTLGIYILEHFFNKSWINLRIYTLILSMLIFARASFNPVSSLIVVLNKNLEGLIFNCYLLAINLIAIYFGYLYEDITKTIIILSIFGGIGYFIILAYFLNHLKYIAKNNV